MWTEFLKISLLSLVLAVPQQLRAQDDNDPADAGPADDAPSGNTAAGEVAPDSAGEGLGEEETALKDQQSKEAEAMEVADSPKVRRFHEVLDELLAEFGYDMKMGQIKGLKNVSIRQVTVNDALPNSYQNYVELLVSERIRENSQVRLISCIICKNKTSRILDGRLVITSPTTNMAEMNRAATSLGIEYFMDVVLVYHSTHMVLAFQVFNTDTKEMIWARTYNSETIKSRFQKLAIDYSQVQKAMPGEDYHPEFRYLAGFGAAHIPNVGGTSDDDSMMMLHFRGTEKFNNRHSEFGLILNIYQSSNALLSDYPSTGTSTTSTSSTSSDDLELTPFSTALGLYVIYAYNLLGEIESYNTTRHSLSVGGGLMLAAGYAAGAIRVGWDIYFGRTFGVVIGGDFIAPSSVIVGTETVATKGGAGGELGVVYNF